MFLAAGAAAVGMLARVLQKYLGGLLYVEWRGWPTDYFVDQGFTRRAFHRMGLSRKADNPDHSATVCAANLQAGTKF
jgi:ABC-type uncharacterized transport system fused permease/ATPase subunit